MPRAIPSWRPKRMQATTRPTKEIVYNRALTLPEIRLLASRRGIGLSPLPDRGGGLPRKLSVNVGGTWRAANAYLNVGVAWKLAQASVNVSGTWR